MSYFVGPICVRVHHHNEAAGLCITLQRALTECFIGSALTIRFCAYRKTHTSVLRTYLSRVIACKSASHHGNMGDLYEHNIAHSFRTSCVAMRSCSQARHLEQPLNPFKWPLLDTFLLILAESFTGQCCKWSTRP